MLDVLVVGAGMCGQTVGWGPLREGIRNIQVIERAPHGKGRAVEHTARMPILRSPKHPDRPRPRHPIAHLPRLVSRVQHGATAGRSSTRSPARLARLSPVGAEVVGLEVENGLALDALDAGRRPPWRRAVDRRDRPRAKVVMANGRDGAGGFRWPRFPSFESGRSAAPGAVHHTLEDIDFAA